MRPLGAICVAAALAVAAAPSAARAAEVSFTAGGTTIFVDAARGETNLITVTRAPGQIVVRDDGDADISETGDCTDAGSSITCPDAGVLGLRIVVADLDDRVTNLTALGSLIRLEAGDDFAAGGSGRDEIYGGSGSDDIGGGDGDDELFGADRAEDAPAGAVDKVAGGPGRDLVTGGAGADVLTGGPGLDQIEGRGGADALLERTFVT